MLNPVQDADRRLLDELKGSGLLEQARTKVAARTLEQRQQLVSDLLAAETKHAAVVEAAVKAVATAEAAYLKKHAIAREAELARNSCWVEQQNAQQQRDAELGRLRRQLEQSADSRLGPFGDAIHVLDRLAEVKRSARDFRVDLPDGRSTIRSETNGAAVAALRGPISQAKTRLEQMRCEALAEDQVTAELKEIAASLTQPASALNLDVEVRKLVEAGEPGHVPAQERPRGVPVALLGR